MIYINLGNMSKTPFIPKYLPPADIDHSAIFTNLIAARDAVARYDEAVKRLPNPDIIQRTFETNSCCI